MIKKRKRSVIWKITKEEFQTIVDSSSSYREILAHFGLAHQGNCRTIKDRINIENISLIKFDENHKNKKQRTFFQERPLEEILIVNSTSHRGSMKKRLIKDSILIQICYECGMEPIWNNKLLVLQLEHINGISNDNRIENLCLLCPNCHSQTSTYAGRKS